MQWSGIIQVQLTLCLTQQVIDIIGRNALLSALDINLCFNSIDIGKLAWYSDSYFMNANMRILFCILNGFGNCLV